MIAAFRGPARQLPCGKWVIEMQLDVAPPELLLAPLGTVLRVMLDGAPREAPSPAPAQGPVQSIGEAGAGDNFTLGGQRALSTVQQATMRYVMALIAMPPFQQYALTRLGIDECDDAQAAAEQYVVQQAGQDLLSEAALSRLRGLEREFTAFWAKRSKHALVFHEALP